MKNTTKNTVTLFEKTKIGNNSVVSLSVINLPSAILLLGIGLILVVLGIIITLVG